MTEQRRYLIPTWVLVVVLVVTSVPNVLWIWANGGISIYGPDPTVLVISYLSELLLVMPPWLALGMLIRRAIRSRTRTSA